MKKIYLSIGKFLGIDIIDVLLKSQETQRKYNIQLTTGIYNALQEIPNCIVESKVKIILENALYSDDYLKIKE